MFYCDALSDTRTSLLCDFMDSMPGAMKNSFCDLPSKSKLEFIISGLGSDTYIHEWQELYNKACGFIHSLYRERAAKYNPADRTVRNPYVNRTVNRTEFICKPYGHV